MNDKYFETFHNIQYAEVWFSANGFKYKTVHEVPEEFVLIEKDNKFTVKTFGINEQLILDSLEYTTCIGKDSNGITYKFPDNRIDYWFIITKRLSKTLAIHKDKRNFWYGSLK